MPKNKKYDDVNRINLTIRRIKAKLTGATSLPERSKLDGLIRALKQELKKLVKEK